MHSCGQFKQYCPKCQQLQSIRHVQMVPLLHKKGGRREGSDWPQL